MYWVSWFAFIFRLPEIYDFISEAYLYETDGNIKTLLKREKVYPGSCIFHKPQLGNTLPVFVWVHYEEFSNVVPMIDLSDEEIEHYIGTYVKGAKDPRSLATYYATISIVGIKTWILHKN